MDWADLNLHFFNPLGNLVENYCRSAVALLPTFPGISGPMCFVEGSLDTPMEEWVWEDCDVPVCDEDCTRDMVLRENLSKFYTIY